MDLRSLFAAVALASASVFYIDCATRSEYATTGQRADDFFLCEEWLDFDEDGEGAVEEFIGRKTDFRLGEDVAVVFVSSWRGKMGIPWSLELLNPGGEIVYRRTKEVSRDRQYSLNRIVLWRFAIYQQWSLLSGYPLLLTQEDDNFLLILRKILKKDVTEGRITREEGDEFVLLCEHDTTTNLGIYAEARRRIPQAYFTEAIRPLLEGGESWTVDEMCGLVCGEWTARWYLDSLLVREIDFTIEQAPSGRQD